MGSWNKSCFSSAKDFPICCISYIAGCSIAGMNAENLGLNPSLWALAYLSSHSCSGAYLRGEIRKKYKIPGHFISDCLLHSFCSACALTQEYSQLMSSPQSHDMKNRMDI